MELSNEFAVGIGIEEAWALLTDVERIAPCMPGAELQEVDGDEYRGVVKVKVGPITATLVPEGEGTKVKVVTDLTITGRAAQFGRGVLADVSTRLLGQFVSCLETKVLAGVGAAGAEAEAQMGAGAPAGASDAGLAAGGNGAGATATTSTAPAGPRTVSHERAEPVNLLETAGAPVLKRLIPAVVGALLAWWALRRLRGRS